MHVPGTDASAPGRPPEDPAATAAAGPGGRPGRSRGGWRRRAAVVLGVVLILCAATVRLFIWPAQGMPRQVDAIVMLNSVGDPLPAALRLARQRRAPVLLVSQGTSASHFACPRRVPGVRLVCFHPSPATTQGEAEFTARMAARYHWRSVAVVTIAPQASRARLRLERCFPGRVYVVTAPLRLRSWPYQLAYEWAATLKALAVQRDC